MSSLHITSHSQEQTEALAAKLAQSFQPGDVIVLTGPLGAGKTAFVRGLAAGRGLDPNSVNSPSYAIVHEYRAQVPLYHFDLFRLHSLAELKEIGWDEYLSRSGITVIEWGERADGLLPARHYVVSIAIAGDEQREITLSLVS